MGVLPASPCFRVVEERWAGKPFGGLDPREVAVLAGALNVHALLQPGARLQCLILRGRLGDLPRLTGSRTRGALWPPERDVLGRVDVESLCGPSNREQASHVVLDLGGPERVLTPPVDVALPRLRAALKRLSPVAVDAVYQWDTDRIDRLRHQESGTLVGRAPVPPAVLPSSDRPRAVLFGMYWLELGGAEKWALATLEAARVAGAVPLVLTDQSSPHPLADHSAMEGAVFLPLTHPLEPGDDILLLRTLLSRFDVRLVHLHHCQWLYERLAWLRDAYPHLPVVDSLHIEEWRTGGFVDMARRASAQIDIHHVISPALAAAMTGDGAISASRVVMRPLLDIDPKFDGAPRAQSAVEDLVRPFTVGFVGRLTQQKRPFLFVATARRLHRSARGRYRFIMHGEGELTETTEGLIERYGLTGVIERRRTDQPVSATYKDCDLILLTSENEGLALVALEAILAGCLVISPDVGGQSSVVPPAMLLPRHPLALLRQAPPLIRRLTDDPPWRAALREQQRQLIEELGRTEGARAWAAGIYTAALDENRPTLAPFPSE